MVFLLYIKQFEEKYETKEIPIYKTTIVMEYDSKYVDVIINRWEEMTGEKAVLISE